MLPVIDEGSRGLMTGGAAQVRLLGKTPGEQRFTAPPCGVRLGREMSIGPILGLGKEIDIVNISDDGVEEDGRWFAATAQGTSRGATRPTSTHRYIVLKFNLRLSEQGEQWRERLNVTY